MRKISMSAAKKAAHKRKLKATRRRAAKMKKRKVTTRKANLGRQQPAASTQDSPSV